jgi:prepilin-type N-terminal cleavage/methylation domain-containing protein
MKKNKKGFTLIELLVVIAIIGLLATLSVVALNSARVKARDAKRVSDIKQIQTALEMYADSAADGLYPAATSSLSTQMPTFPTNPSPRNDGGCANSDYVYARTGATAGSSYTLTYCLGSGANAGVLATATPAGVR